MLVVLALAACGGGDVVDCERTITAASDRTIAFGARVGLPIAGAEHTRRTMIAACEADRWSGEVMRCLAAAQRETDLVACTEKLTHEQYVRLHRNFVTEPPAADAGVDQPLWVGPMPIDAGTPAIPGAVPAAPAGCANAMSQPRSRACIAEYCSHHPDDLRCLLE